jgi:hypothetical protein
MGNRNGIMGNKIADVDLAYDCLRTSPMFKLSLSSKELFHSNFLEWLSNVSQDAFKDLILDMAGIKKVDYKWPDIWRVKREYNNFDLCVVAYDQDQYKNNEDERIDDDDDFRILFVIENKVKSIPYKEQLERYTQEAEDKNKAYWRNRGSAKLKEYGINGNKNDGKYWIGVEKDSWVLKQCVESGRGKKTKWSEPISLDVQIRCEGAGKMSKTNFIDCYAKWGESENASIHYILLSLAKNFPEYDGGDVWKVKETTDWKICNYCDYKSKIEKAFNGIAKGLDSQIIEDYCKFIECLTTLSKEWAKDYEEKSQETNQFLYSDNINYKRAHQLRIHDLYQKLKFSYLCTEMFKKVNDTYGNEYKVFPSNQGGLFKENKSEKNIAFICVNYTFLHGDPLLEINIHPKYEEKEVDFYYAIQVQGNAYEHGIQVKKNEETIKFLNHQAKDKFSMTVWNSLNNGGLKIIKGWMTVQDSTWEKEEWMSESQKKDYNKYDMNDGTFVYQKYTISEDTTIATIKNKMLDDLEYIIENLKTSRCIG